MNCGSSQNEKKFVQAVEAILKELNEVSKHSTSLNTFEVIHEEISKIDNIEKITETDEDVCLLKTIPGVEAVTALTFKLKIDDPFRFKKSRSVGALCRDECGIMAYF